MLPWEIEMSKLTIQLKLSFSLAGVWVMKHDTKLWKMHHQNYNVFFNSPKLFSPPEIVLKSFLEHKSCACVVCFARLALTQAGSCKENSKHHLGMSVSMNTYSGHQTRHGPPGMKRNHLDTKHERKQSPQEPNERNQT